MKPPQILPFLLITPLLASGCPNSNTEKGIDTSSDYWCESVEAAQDDYEITDGGGSSVSGLLVGRLITDGGDDIHDPSIVGGLDITLTPTSSGGSGSLETTDAYGDFQHTLGAGSWVLVASKTRSGGNCAANYEFEIVADKTTTACILLTCS